MSEILIAQKVKSSERVCPGKNEQTDKLMVICSDVSQNVIKDASNFICCSMT